MAGKNEYIYVSGKTSWTKLVIPDQKYDKWGLRLHPDADSLEKIRELQSRGLKNTVRKDDDGWYTNFSRPTKKVYKGIVKLFEPPLVINKDGEPIADASIGNGSDVTIKLEVYEHSTPGGGTAVAARLDTVRIDNLIPYEPKRDLPEPQQEQYEGMADQPERLF